MKEYGCKYSDQDVPRHFIYFSYTKVINKSLSYQQFVKIPSDSDV